MSCLMEHIGSSALARKILALRSRMSTSTMSLERFLSFDPKMQVSGCRRCESREISLEPIRRCRRLSPEVAKNGQVLCPSQTRPQQISVLHCYMLRTRRVSALRMRSQRLWSFCCMQRASDSSEQVHLRQAVPGAV